MTDSAVQRRRFIQAAVRTIARHGVDGATTRRIASQADIPLAALHYRFESKRNLLTAVFDHLAEVIIEALAKPPRSPASVGADAAPAVLTGFIQWINEHRDEAAASLEMVQWTTRHEPERASRAYGEILRQTHEAVATTASPAATPDSIAARARLIIALADGLTMQLQTHGEPHLTRLDTSTAAAMLGTPLATEDQP